MQAQAQLANAEATQLQAQLNVNKYTPLAEEQAASQQDRDNAVQTNVAAKATVLNSKAAIEAAEAAVKTARINLDFTPLPATIASNSAPAPAHGAKAPPQCKYII